MNRVIHKNDRSTGTTEIPVLIVGSGGAGLTMALLLRQQGIATRVVERRPDVAWYPRARALNFRSLEVFRGLGLADEIRAKGSRVARIYARPTLASREQREVMDPADQLDTRSLSPEPFLLHCPQSRSEPILGAAARQRGVELSYGAELVAFRQSDTEVEATLHERATGRSETVRAQYLVGADGAHSAVRAALGIPTKGTGQLEEHWVFLYFRGGWDRFVGGHEGDAFVIERPDARGILMQVDRDLGMFIVNQGGRAAPLTLRDGQELLARAIGSPNSGAEVFEIAPWRPEQRIAERFREGRVVLVGDAAHTMPPKQGLGVNTAIQSAQNLAWKLAAVMRGSAPPRLLDTYEAERGPVAWFTAQQSMTGVADALFEGKAPTEANRKFSLTVGYQYLRPGGIALLEGAQLGGASGTRVPHAWLERSGRPVSTLDLFDGGFVLFVGPNGTAWRKAAEALAARRHIRLETYRIGPGGDLEDPQREWLQRAAILGSGAMLVRPDSFVAWRVADLGEKPEEALRNAVDEALEARPAETPR